MSYLEKKVLKDVQFYITTKYSCGYINGQDAQSIVATPYKNINSKNFNSLMKKVLEGVGNIYISQTAKVAQHVSL